MGQLVMQIMLQPNMISQRAHNIMTCTYYALIRTVCTWIMLYKTNTQRILDAVVGCSQSIMNKQMHVHLAGKDQQLSPVSASPHCWSLPVLLYLNA